MAYPKFRNVKSGLFRPVLHVVLRIVHDDHALVQAHEVVHDARVVASRKAIWRLHPLLVKRRGCGTLALPRSLCTIFWVPSLSIFRPQARVPRGVMPWDVAAVQVVPGAPRPGRPHVR